MLNPSVSRAMAAVFGCAALLAAGAARAELGAAPMATPDGASVTAVTSIPLARAAAQTQAGVAASSASAASSSSAATYTIRQTSLASGTVVREYLSSAGTVFAVGWNGPHMPNLSTLLGTYFPQYVAGVKASHAAGILHGPGVVQQDSLVVHSGGHMGAFFGEAWLPQALPAGFSTSAIQ